MKIIPSIVTLLFLIAAGTVSSPAQNATTVEPLLVYKALQDKDCRHWVDSVMDKLSFKEKVGQLFIYTIAPVDTKRNLELLREVIDTYKVGGLLFSGGKMQNQVELTNRAQRQAKVPLMITFDGEWGLAMRLRGMPVFPRNMVLGCIRDNKLLYEYGREVARQCRQIGVQVNFAPVADVNINPENPVINTRSFGEDPIQVADKVIAYASGLESGGVLSVCKHFPGHGDTDVDSHKALPVLPFTRERLDSVELYPFKEAIRAGLGGMMVGHLQVPVIEPIGGLPSSLSRNVVYDLLTDELAFKGLIFTDALAMKGVAGNGYVSLQALKAGNDMVLSPRNLKEEIPAVLEAIEKGELTREDIESKCRKVLTYKYVLGLKKKSYVQLSGLEQRINSPQTRDLVRRLNLAAITVLNNKNHILPLHTDKEQKIALLEVGDPGETNALAKQLSRYTSLARFSLRANQTEEENQRLRDSLSTYKRIIVAVSEQRLAPYQPFFAKFVPESPAIYLFFTPGKMMLQIQRAVAHASAVVLGHSYSSDVQRQVADVLFAKASADGQLSASLGELFPAGAGVTITPKTPLHFVPEEYGLSSAHLKRIDSIALDGIRQGAYPGCQVVVLKNGHVMFDKAFGTYTGKGSSRVESTNIYDLASLSKTTGTLLAIMKLYDKGRFNLTDKISDHLPFLQRTDKKDITIQEILYHQSGLPSWIPFYQEAIDKDSYDGKLFSARKDAHHPLQLGTTSWANPKFKFKSEYVSSVKTGDYTVQICDSLWLNRSFRKVIEEKIAEAPLKQKRYVYSDVGFILLGMLVEQLAGMPMEAYLQREFYEPMGLEHTGYLPLRRFAKSEIVPSNKDHFLRKETLQGVVHDEASAFFGGLAGNAGLFSTARDVARVYQMLLNGGEIDGQRYLSKETCQLFTTETSKISRRGLGFDKPDADDPKKGNCAPAAPAEVYGHTGFTGTCAWVDPVNELVYVFLSNRIYPDVTNRKLNQLHIRERIQGAIYDAMKKK
ncbi:MULTISPECIES: glycoside hydrolase family 3 N-terminal domain-containing protein [Bacteroides]|jgi:beta-glucosidase-like glycosyl hydrolase/CubicO group peptidase (beta-lactamase class C family)|uniref:glycoside hydrolase family 3 N-terminal domain-containing protein n=1 Tax=Bacteroides TaxID=816 RepID=UPI000E4C30CD|nr:MULTISPECIES: glycoside hydrolase family 3 N-terminal domain-containing protein [Bacteroides]MCS3198846.1 serine hydrolase [Candidatus Bacteroides intestinigallinarum]QNL39478.1 serine hydrolase [Bacteroides sp. M10]RGR01159.1 beta-N-acetylglucosaminidase [Bacteroides sp. AF26-7BH]RGY30954.1 beta-N-acetylglucosaminidase [Bacteroides sp. OF02-3LB]